MSTDFDIAIIGAGIAGASLAWALGQHSGGKLKVALLEMESRPGYHTTGRSAAFWVESYGGPGVVPLSRASRDFFVNPPASFGPLLSHRPSLSLMPPGQPEALAALEADFVKGGTQYERWDAARLAASPAAALFRPEWLQAGLFEDDCYDIDVAALHQGYLKGVDGWKPVLVTDAEVTGLVQSAGRWQISSRAGAFTAGTVVNAAGAWADQLAGLAGAKPVGLTPLRRTMAVLRLASPPPADLPVVFAASGDFYVKPDGGRLWLSPHDETPDVPHDVRPDEMDLAVVIDRFEQASTATVTRLESSWAGLRTFAPDRVPVLGWDAAVPGLFWCAGQGGFGIQTAPAMAALGAALLLGEAPPLDPAPWLASRFA
jgi:D-arginine dehydrogenase